MTVNEIRTELRRKGWRVSKGAWACPWRKQAFQRLTLREAASLEALRAIGELPPL